MDVDFEFTVARLAKIANNNNLLEPSFVTAGGRVVVLVSRRVSGPALRAILDLP